MNYNKFIKHNVAPPGATGIGLFNNSSNEKVDEITNLKSISSGTGTKLYSFAVVTDVHNSDDLPNDENNYMRAYTVLDFERAVKFINDKTDAEFIACCGDISKNGAVADIDGTTTAGGPNAGHSFNNTLRNTSINKLPFYMCLGNHETYDVAWGEATEENPNSNYIVNPANYEEHIKKLRTLHLTNKPLPLGVTHDITELDGIPCNFTVTRGNDMFIFVSITSHEWANHYWPVTDIRYKNAYETSTVNWLKLVMLDNSDKRFFVFIHIYFKDRAGNFSNLYHESAATWFENSTLKTIQDQCCDVYKNSYWFSGHSHWVWEMLKEYYGLVRVMTRDSGDTENSYKTRTASEELTENGQRNLNANIWPATGTRTTGWCIHVPSCGDPRSVQIMSGAPTMTVDGDPGNPKKGTSSLFAMVDVYENYIIIKGASWDGTTYKYLPIATYKLSTALASNNLVGNVSSNNVITVSGVEGTYELKYLDGNKDIISGYDVIIQ